MRDSELDVVVDNLYFPECMRWHDGKLWFSDMFEGTVNRVVPGRAPRQVADVGAWCGGLGWSADGNVLVTSMYARHVIAIAPSGRMSVHADLSTFFAYPINDMYTDSVGRAYVTGYGFDADNGGASRSVKLCIVEPDGAARVTEEEFLFPNGIDRLPDGRILVAETFADTLSAIEVTGGAGSMVTSTFARLPAGDGPDGISCDRSGGVWVACAFGEKVVHIDRTGRVDRAIPVPDVGVFDCLLVEDTLFVAVAAKDEQYAASHTTGRILVARVDP